MNRRCAWIFGLVAIALANARSAAAAEPSAPRVDPKRVADFGIDATALEREGEDIGQLVRSLDKRVRTELTQRVVEVGASDAARLRLVLRWLDYDRSDYLGKFEIQYVGTEQWTDAARFECFACSSTALAKQVVAALPTAIDALARPPQSPAEPTHVAVGPPEGEPPGHAAPPPTTPKPKPRPLGPLGKAGIATLVVGAGASVGGIVLLARGRGTTSQEEVDLDLRTPGAAVLAVGVAVAVTGAVLLIVDRRRARKPTHALSPSLGRRHVGVAFTLRF